ncbi:MAG: hypothetical protein KAR35_08900, partial [Candidatus Heimdallarchaeota archaeon]|nr:hypothetical protein [Candidatus Heimdallarchaeota archaeon]MCK5049474.1 hypothetical protein [Candidatus Heimdallarchaeota archaeon]
QASSTKRRFDALQELRANGIHGGVCLMPIIPKIADDMTNLIRILDEAVKADAEFVMWGYLTLKPDNKKYFLDKTVRPFYPEHVSYYLDAFEKKWYTWDVEVVKKLRKEIIDRGLSEITPLPVPFGRNKTNLPLTEKIYHKSYELSFTKARESMERKALIDLAKKLITFPHSVTSSSNEVSSFLANLSEFQQEQLSEAIDQTNVSI